MTLTPTLLIQAATRTALMTAPTPTPTIFPSIFALMSRARQCQEGVVHVDGGLGARLHELDAVLDGQLGQGRSSSSNHSHNSQKKKRKEQRYITQKLGS